MSLLHSVTHFRLFVAPTKSRLLAAFWINFFSKTTAEELHIRKALVHGQQYSWNMHALQASPYAEAYPVLLQCGVCTSYHILKTLYCTKFFSFEHCKCLESLQNAVECLLNIVSTAKCDSFIFFLPFCFFFSNHKKFALLIFLVTVTSATNFGCERIEIIKQKRQECPYIHCSSRNVTKKHYKKKN